MAASRQILRSASTFPSVKSVLTQTLRFKTTSTTPSHHNQHQLQHEFSKPSEFLGSWKAPKDPKEAEANLGLLRRDYAKQVKEVRKQYIYEMELQKQEKQLKDEAKRKAIRIAREERKAAKVAMAQARAAERKVLEEEFRQTLLKKEDPAPLWRAYLVQRNGEAIKGWEGIKEEDKLSTEDLNPKKKPRYWSNFALLTKEDLAPLWRAYLVQRNGEAIKCWEGIKEEDKLSTEDLNPKKKPRYWSNFALLKERTNKLEYWRSREKRVEGKKSEKKELLHRQSSMWIDEQELEKKILEAIVDTTPL